MKTFIPSFTLLFLYFSITSLHAQQQVLFEQKTNPEFLIRQSDLAGEAQIIFQRLAEGQNRPPSSIELTLNYEQTTRVLKSGVSDITAVADNRKFHVKGDVFYKGFDMSELLVPDQMTFASVLRAVNSDLQPRQWNDDVNIDDGTAARVEHTITDTTNTSWKMEITRQKFFFRSAVVNRFNARVNLVANYYAASSNIEQLHQKLLNVNPSDVDRLDFQNEILLSIENEVGNMEAAGYDRNLGLASFDPLRFLPRFDALRNETFAKRAALDDARRNLYIHFYNTALDLQARGKRQMARNYFNRSLHENPLFAPAAYQLARMNFEEGNFDDADEQGSDIVTRMNPDPDIRRLTMDLLNSTYKQYLSEADQYLGQKKYNEAISVLERARKLCRNVSGVRCNDAMNVSYRKACNGRYQQILDDGRRYYQEGNMDAAEEKAQSALRYRESHAAEIPDAGDAATLLKAIRQKNYANRIDEGKIAIRQQSYEQALELFYDADAMQQRYQLKTDANLDTLKKQAAKAVLLADISKGNELSKANNLGEARKLSKKILAMQNSYGLNTDKELNRSFNEFKENIFSQQCANAQNTLDNYSVRMHEAIVKKDYVGADRLFKQADSFLQDNEECSLNNATLRATHDSIIPAYVYQALVQEALELQSTGRFAEAVAKYAETDTYYHRYDVSNFGLNHFTLAAFAVDRCNNDFLLFLGNNFRSRKEFDNSLEMYKALLVRGLSPGHFKNPLYQLGFELAIRDRQLLPSADPKQKVLEYTAGNKQLKQLSKGYQKGWKKNS